MISLKAFRLGGQNAFKMNCPARSCCRAGLNNKNNMPQSYHFRDLESNANLKRRLSQESPDSRLFRGRLFPSGRITVGFLPKKKISKADREYERTRPEVVYFERQHWDYEEGLVKEVLPREEKPQTLGLSSISNHHKEGKRRHGLKGLPRSGRYRILEGATVLQQRYGRRLGFYTLTCPYTEVELVYEYNKNFSEIMRRFFQEIKREFSRKHDSFVYCAAYEVQPARFEKTGLFALHAHWISPCYHDGTREFILTADEIRDIYSRVCSSVVGVCPDCSASLDAQVIKKKASSYLAKYLSKGGEMISSIAEVAPSQLPSRWWSCSRSVLRAINRLTMELSQELCATLMLAARSTQSQLPFLYYIRSISIPTPLGDRNVGLAAAATPSFAQSLRPILYEDILYEIL